MSFDTKSRIELGKKTFKRSGNILTNIILQQSNILTGQQCLDIFNTYGIPAHIVIIIGLAHGFNIEEDEFAKLLDAQEKSSKESKLC